MIKCHLSPGFMAMMTFTWWGFSGLQARFSALPCSDHERNIRLERTARTRACSQMVILTVIPVATRVKMIVLEEESRSRDHLIEGSDQAVSSQYCFSGASSSVREGPGELAVCIYKETTPPCWSVAGT